MTTNLQIDIREDALTDAAVLALLEAHLTLMHAITPAESVHALDPGRLRAPGVTAWSAWHEGEVVGVAALKALDEIHGEVKSMHTLAVRRGLGVGARLLTHLMSVAVSRGYRRLSLETGSMAEFAAARRLYERHGFDYCPPFADYQDDPNSVFMTRLL